MTMKKCATDIKIEVRGSRDAGEWVDISDLVCGLTLDAQVGSVYELTLAFWNDPTLVQVTGRKPEQRHRVATDDTIIVGGVDISYMVHAWSISNRVGELERLEVNLLPDDDLIRINGRSPFWD